MAKTCFTPCYDKCKRGECGYLYTKDDRQAEILKANYAVFMRRATDQNYGDDQDRIMAAKQAEHANNEFEKLTGVRLISWSNADNMEKW